MGEATLKAVGVEGIIKIRKIFSQRSGHSHSAL